MGSPEKALAILLSASIFSSCQRAEEQNHTLYDWLKLNNSLYYNNECDLDDDSLKFVKQLAAICLQNIDLARAALSDENNRVEAKKALRFYSRMYADLEELALKNHVLLNANLEPDLEEPLPEFGENYFNSDLKKGLVNLELVLKSAKSLRKRDVRDFALIYLDSIKQFKNRSEPANLKPD